MDIPETIICVDCGEEAHLISIPSQEGWQVGDYVAYRCGGCNDRWDLVIERPDAQQAATSSPEARAFLDYHRKGEE